MATNPDAIIGQLLANTGFGQTSQQIAAANIANQQGQQNLQAGQQAIDINAFKLSQAKQQAEQEQAQKAAYNADIAAWTAAGSPPSGLATLAAKYPEQWQAFQLSFKSGNEAQKKSDMQFYGGVHSLLTQKTPDLKTVRTLLSQRRAALEKAGQDTRVLDDYIQGIDAGDQTAIAGLKALSLASQAATDPDQYAQIYKVTDDKPDTKVVGQGGALVDDTGKVLYTAPKTEYRTIKNADGSESIVEVGTGNAVAKGGDPSSAAAGRFTGGWTPRARNGGDNPDNVVDNKIAGAAKYLGVSPTGDISGKTPMQIAQALALSEGGAGSLADRNNNPGNLRNPKTGEYMKFPTKEAGLRAAAAQVARNLKRGQTTVQSMIEGLPVGGRGGGAPTNPSQTGGGARVVFKSAPAEQNPVDQATVNFYAQKIAAGGDLPQLGSGKESSQWRRAILQRAAEIQNGQGVSGADSNLQRADVKSASMALTQLQKTRSNIEGFERTFMLNVDQVLKTAPKGVAGGVPVFNAWVQAGRKATGDPDVARFNVAINTAANEYAKLASGASGGAVTSDSARHEAMQILNNAQTLPQLQAAIKQMQIDGHNRVIALQEQENRLRSTIAGRPVGPGQKGQPSAAPVRVSTPAQAQKLAPGTLYVAPDGKVRRR